MKNKRVFSFWLVVVLAILALSINIAGMPAYAQSGVQPTTPTSPMAPTPDATLPAAPAPALAATPTPPLLTKTEILTDTRGFLLLVNGQPITITGMNYNVDYTRLPQDTKLALHRRDFKIMKDAGVNAIVGWGIYDEATLQVANEFGVGVIMPYDLEPQGAFDNQDYCNQIKANFVSYVQRYKGFTAVWAWNPGGDELLYRMDSQEHRTPDKLQAAADFLVELETTAHTIDPNHVSVIKEPRDFYIPYLDTAMHKPLVNPDVPDSHTFHVFGLNVYGHPDDVLAALQAGKRNAEQRMGVALLVTEFAPFNLPLKDRATYLVQIWDEIQASSPNGGMVYVFGPDQPNPQYSNPYDPLHLLPNEFTLVDNQGNPVDRALEALAGRYRQVRSAAIPQ